MYEKCMKTVARGALEEEATRTVTKTDNSRQSWLFTNLRFNRKATHVVIFHAFFIYQKDMARFLFY